VRCTLQGRPERAAEASAAFPRERANIFVDFEKRAAYIGESALDAPFFQPGKVLFRRSPMSEVGWGSFGFDPALSNDDDWDDEDWDDDDDWEEDDDEQDDDDWDEGWEDDDEGDDDDDEDPDL
jgi:hypothetical protein